MTKNASNVGAVLTMVSACRPILIIVRAASRTKKLTAFLSGHWYPDGQEEQVSEDKDGSVTESLHRT
jgi:hypothetical protein